MTEDQENNTTIDLTVEYHQVIQLQEDEAVNLIIDQQLANGWKLINEEVGVDDETGEELDILHFVRCRFTLSSLKKLIEVIEDHDGA